MRILVAIVLAVLALPVLVLVGIVLGPAMLLVLFAAGCAFLIGALVWLAARAGLG